MRIACLDLIENKELLTKVETECKLMKSELLYIKNIENCELEHIIILGLTPQCMKQLKKVNNKSIIVVSDNSIDSIPCVIRNWSFEEFLTLPYCLLPLFINLSAIVCIDKDYGIGYQGQMLGHYSEDLKFFKKMTEGNGILVGRKTLESFPKGKPLPNRDNIVLSHNNIENVHSIQSLYELLELSTYQQEKQLFLAGGSSLYFQFLHLCNQVYVTQTNEKHSKIDNFFPNMETNKDYVLIENRPSNGLNFLTYKRKELICKI